MIFTPALPDLLAQELAHLERFCSLLDQERLALGGGQAERLPILANEKAALAATLSQLQAEREKALAAARLPAGRAGMDLWLSSEGGRHRPAWDRLLQLALHARDANEANGRLIGVLLRQNQDALAVLTSGASESIYGPDGQKRGSTPGRSLGSA